MTEAVGFIGLGNMGRLAMACGMAEQDHTAIARIIEEWAGVSLRSPGGTT